MSDPKAKTKTSPAKPLTFGSAALLAFLLLWESGGSRELTAYADKLAGGLPTVCNGLTRHVTKTPIVVGARWTTEQCVAEEAKAIATMQARLLRCFTTPPPQEVFDAASSHAWNNGVSATCGSAAMKAWNRGEWELGCRRLAIGDNGRPVWSFVKDGRNSDGTPRYKFVQGLANRRHAERRWCAGEAA